MSSRYPSDVLTQRGVGMLEVLIALLILAVGVLGFAGLQMTALAKSNDANHRAAAVLIAQDAIERFELNPTQRTFYLTKSNWAAGAAGAVPPGGCINAEDPCSAAMLAETDTNQLAWQAANTLPAGRTMAADCDFNSQLTCVIVSWDGENPSDCMEASGLVTGETSRCFVMEVAR